MLSAEEAFQQIKSFKKQTEKENKWFLPESRKSLIPVVGLHPQNPLNGIL